MDSIFKKYSKVICVVFRTFFVVSLILAVVTVCLLVNGVNKKNNFVPGQGKIIGFDEKVSDGFSESESSVSMSPIIEYTVDGQNFEFVGGYYSSSMKVGDSIDIMYNKNDLSKAIVAKGLFFGSIITGALSLFFWGLYLFYRVTKKETK